MIRRMRIVYSWLAFLGTMTSLLQLVVTDATTEEESTPSSSAIVVDPWPPATSSRPSVNDLFREYDNIFRYGNRNAASHRWSTFLLDRANQMTMERLELFFAGFCAVSGSPIRPSDYNRYRLTLPQVVGNETASSATVGYMHYCCWPCVCDTQDFIRVDTLNVTSRDGVSRQRHFTVIGNPCHHPEQLEVPFVQPFYGRQATTLSQVAREVRCTNDGSLEGATISDHGYIIIGMFFDAKSIVAVPNETASAVATTTTAPLKDPTPGRISRTNDGVMFQDEREFEPHCIDRANNEYNSGMGEIFRQVSAISPILLESPHHLPAAVDSTIGDGVKGDGQPSEPRIATEDEAVPPTDNPDACDVSEEGSSKQQ